MRARSYDAWLALEPEPPEDQYDRRGYWRDLANAYEREAQLARKSGKEERAERWQRMADAAHERAKR
jgi:hypothetical protein